MSEQVATVSSEYDPLAGLNEGFLGTGYSSMVEASFIAMALIACYVAFATARYLLSGNPWFAAMGNAVRSSVRSVAEAVGLREI